jgi:hypothetical protein
MLNNNLLSPPPTTARRRLFQDYQQPTDALNIAKDVEQKFLRQKQEQWSFDFINDIPVEGLWQWSIIVAARSYDECCTKV